MGSIVKANFRATGQGAGKASAGMSSLEYMAQRPDLNGDEMDREIITRDGRYRLSDEDEKRKLERDLESSKGEYLYRVVLSSGDKEMTAKETEQWAKAVLEKNDIHNYMIVIHADEQGHTDNPHAHVLIPTDYKLNRNDLDSMRKVGDDEQKQMSYSIKMTPPMRREWDDAAQSSGKGGGGKQAEQENDDQGQKKRQVDIHFGR